MNWYLQVLKNYAVFNGRARRKEFWMFALFNMIFLIIASLIDNAAGSTSGELPYGLFYFLYAFAVLIPGLAVSVRRLHDVGKSGWMIFILFIPFIGAIWILVLMVTDSNPFENKYGKNPKQELLIKDNSYQNTANPKVFNLRTEQDNFLVAIKAEWGYNVEFFAGDAFNLISEDYLNWYIEETDRKKVYCLDHRESATLELLEKFRLQGLLTKRVDDDSWYYLLINKSLKTEPSNSKNCKAYKNGRCISQQTGADTGACSWKPDNWKSCGVVVESIKLYGKW